MKNAPFIAISLCLAILSSCSSVQIQKDWNKKKERADFQKEKSIFKERLGGRSICPSGVAYFASPSWAGDTPLKDCVYPASHYIYDSQQRAVTQANQALYVLQATQAGFLVKPFVQRSGVFVHKTDEEGIVDGSYLDKTIDGSLYEYTGTYTYQTPLGPKTVHSFKKLPRGALQNAMRGLKVYSFEDEFLADSENWWALKDRLENSGQGK